jgi:hypothetical protein
VFGRKRKPQLSRDDALAAKPARAVEAEMKKADDGSGKLTVKLRKARVAWLFRVPEGATKTFEFDPIGVFVWEQIDGKTTVEQVIRRLAKEYTLNLREAEVPTITFLQTLIGKGLIVVPVEEKK